MQLQNNEELELDSLRQNNEAFNRLSLLGQYVGDGAINKNVLEVVKVKIIKQLSDKTSWLSIVASTSPFIGLFGTVVGILESFAKFGVASKVSFSAIAPAISQALVATAAGIFVAIFAYTFHQILSRKLYEIDVSLSSQIMLISSNLPRY
jgi:biopolymer transport protein ExbB/TolQ